MARRLQPEEALVVPLDFGHVEQVVDEFGMTEEERRPLVDPQKTEHPIFHGV